MRHELSFTWRGLAFNVIGGLAIVIVSFVTTLYVIDRAVSTVDRGTDRQGGDYRSVIQTTITVEACVSECERDPLCRSWALVRNGIMRPEMTCLLKNKDSQPTSNACCTSGKVSRSIRSFFE